LRKANEDSGWTSFASKEARDYAYDLNLDLDIKIFWELHVKGSGQNDRNGKPTITMTDIKIFWKDYQDDE
jgi:hypothetical protein